MYLSELLEKLGIWFDLYGDFKVVFEESEFATLHEIQDAVIKEVGEEEVCVISDHQYKREIQEQYYEN